MLPFAHPGHPLQEEKVEKGITEKKRNFGCKAMLGAVKLHLCEIVKNEEKERDIRMVTKQATGLALSLESQRLVLVFSPFFPPCTISGVPMCYLTSGSNLLCLLASRRETRSWLKNSCVFRSPKDSKVVQLLAASRPSRAHPVSLETGRTAVTACPAGNHPRLLACLGACWAAYTRKLKGWIRYKSPPDEVLHGLA